MTSTMNTTEPRLFESADQHTRGISIGTWTVSSTKLPILNAQECDAAAAELHLPLPEICFGNNRLQLRDDKTGITFEWNALAALHQVSQDTPIKVAHAAEWARGQASGSAFEVTVQKPYDWTYTTTHPGSTSLTVAEAYGTATAAAPSLPVPQPPTFVPAPESHPGIPLHLLANQEIPILFYDEIPLFEDELGDNGIAELVVRVRVNSFSIFVLSRFFLRIDNVLFRIYDVRLYHDIRTGQVIRDMKGRQAPYDFVKKRLPVDRSDDLTPLTNVNWVAQQLEVIATSPDRPLPLRAPVGPGSRFTLGNNNSNNASSGSRRSQTELGTPAAPSAASPSPSPSLSLPVWEAEGRRLEILTL